MRPDLTSSQPFIQALRDRVPIAPTMRFVRGASWPLADQALISATNFFGMVVAARVFTTEDFGLYALAYAGMWLANSVQAALVTQPFGVLASRRDLDEYRRFASATALMQIGLTLLIGLPVMAVGLWLGGSIGPILVASGFTIIMWQFHEFIRRILYVEGRMSAVLTIDLLSYGGQLIVIVALAATGGLTIVTALLAAGFTSAIAACVGLVLVRATLWHPPLPGAIAENLVQGRWLLGAEIGGFLCLNSYPFILAATNGVDGPHLVAVYTATHLLLNPLNVIWFATVNVVPLRLSRTRADHGEGAARAELRTFYRMSVPLVAGYCLITALLGEMILDLVYGSTYAGYGWVITAAALFRIFAYHGHLVALGLRSLEMTRPIFFGFAAAVPFSLIVGSILTASIGILGAIITMFGAATIWTIIWARAYFRGTGTSPVVAGANS